MKKWFEVVSRETNEQSGFEADECSLSDEMVLDLQRGKRVEDWPSRPCFWASDSSFDGEIEDVVKTSNLLPVFSPRLVDALNTAGICGIQYLPVNLRRSPTADPIAGYCVANILKSDCILDLERSVIRKTSIVDRSGTAREWIAFVSRGVIDQSKVQDCDVARLVGYFGVWYVSSAFVDVFKRKRLSGVGFLELGK